MNRKAIFCLCKALCFVFLSGAFFRLEAQEATSLLLNAPVSRAFKSGERHLFSLSARENESIEITCERRGVDVALAAFAPNGEKISASNSPGGFNGFDRLFFIAEKTGEYRIELDSRRPGTTSGSYTILLKNERAASEDDSKRARAMKFLGEARENLSGAENRLSKAEEAFDKLEKALPLFEKTEDLQGQANAVFQMAVIKGYEF